MSFLLTVFNIISDRIIFCTANCIFALIFYLKKMQLSKKYREIKSSQILLFQEYLNPPKILKEMRSKGVNEKALSNFYRNYLDINNPNLKKILITGQYLSEYFDGIFRQREIYIGSINEQSISSILKYLFLSDYKPLRIRYNHLEDVFYNSRDITDMDKLRLPVNWNLLFLILSEWSYLYRMPFTNRLAFTYLALSYKKNCYLDKDIICAYGRINKFKNTFDADLIVQGNKITVLKLLKKSISKYNMGLIFSVTALLLNGLFYILRMIKKNNESKTVRVSQYTLTERKENCTMCKTNYKNVALLACNHFNLCEKCFRKAGRKCQLCGSEGKMGYLVFTD